MLGIQTKKSILITIFGLYTLITYVWVLSEFFTKGEIEVPVSVSAIYLVALSIYVGDKEIKRLLLNHTHPLRHGEYYAYLWGITFIIIEIFMLTGGGNMGYMIPPDMTTNAGVVILFYFISDFLKTNCPPRSRKKKIAR